MTVLFCKIPEKQKLKALKKSLAFGFFGCFLILVSSLKSCSVLKQFFRYISFSGICFVIFGLLPQKRLAFLEKNPHKIFLETDYFVFYFFNLPLIKINKSIINEIKYVSRKNDFGINLYLKIKEKHDKIILLEKNNKKIKRFFNTYSSLDQDNTITVFLPFFSESSSCTLKEWL